MQYWYRYDLSGMDGAVLEVRAYLGLDKPSFLNAHDPVLDFFIDENVYF